MNKWWKSLYWYPHFAVGCYWDGEQIVCRCLFHCFNRAFMFGMPSYIRMEQFKGWKQP